MSFSGFSTQPQQNLFQPQSQPNSFQQTNLFQQTQQQQQQPQQFQFQQQQQQQQQQLYLLTNDKTPATYNTKWADLHPDSQKILLQIEERILEFRDESQRLDQCSRLYDSSVSNDGFELDASHIVQELGGISTGMEREKIVLQELMVVIKDIMRNTELAVRSFMILRPRFIHPKVGAAANVNAQGQAQGAPSAITPSVSTSSVPEYDFYSGLPRRPSPFMQQTVARLEKYLGECRQCVEELEQLLLSDSERSSGSDSSLLRSLPKVLSNVHDFFVHVAAKVESLHQGIESMKSAYLADQRRRGDSNDPFLEADRRQLAKQEAASKRVHPTLHLPAVSQPSTQVAGLFAGSAAPAINAPQPSLGTTPASSGSGFSLFTSPAAAPSANLFSTPASAPTPSLFGSPAASPQPPILGTLQPSLFGPTPAQSFGSSPATGTSPFSSTPFASGQPAGSGSSFGNASKSRPKSRTARR